MIEEFITKFPEQLFENEEWAEASATVFSLIVKL